MGNLESLNNPHQTSKMKNKSIMLFFLLIVLSACSTYNTATPTSVSTFSNKQVTLGTSLQQFQREHKRSTSKDMRIEGEINVVELHYVEYARLDTYIKTVFRFENDKLVSQKQTTEIVPANKVQYKHTK